LPVKSSWLSPVAATVKYLLVWRPFTPATMPAAVRPQERVFQSPPVLPNVVARVSFCHFQQASTIGDFIAGVGVRRLFCHDFPACHSITLVAPRTVRASRADHFRCFLLRRPPFNRARLRLHLLPSVCFVTREKQNAPASRSQTRKKIK
jgi:hypothetical protein